MMTINYRPDLNSGTHRDAIRMARGLLDQRGARWVYDWTPGPTYGSRRRATFAEIRAKIEEGLPRARAYLEARADIEMKRERALADPVDGPRIRAHEDESHRLFDKSWTREVGSGREAYRVAIRDIVCKY